MQRLEGRLYPFLLVSPFLSNQIAPSPPRPEGNQFGSRRIPKGRRLTWFRLLQTLRSPLLTAEARSAPGVGGLLSHVQGAGSEAAPLRAAVLIRWLSGENCLPQRVARSSPARMGGPRAVTSDRTDDCGSSRSPHPKPAPQLGPSSGGREAVLINSVSRPKGLETPRGSVTVSWAGGNS